MAWIEARRNGCVVRWYVDGKKKFGYFDDRLDAEQFRADLVYGKPEWPSQRGPGSLAARSPSGVGARAGGSSRCGRRRRPG